MRTSKRLLHYAKRYKSYLIIGLIALAISVAADVSGPFIAKKIIDDHIATATNSVIAYQPIIQLLAIFFGLAVITAIFRYTQFILLQTGASRIIQNIRNDVYQHVQTLPIRYFDDLPAGKVVSRITNDTETIQQLFVTVIAQFASGIMTLIGIYIALFILDWRMALIALVLLPLLALWIMVYRKYAAKYNYVIRSRLSDMNARINESIQGMPIIQAYGQEQKIQCEFDEVNDEHFRYNNKLLILDAATSFSLADLLRSFVFVTFIIVFGSIAIDTPTAVSAGLLYAFVDYITRLFNPIVNMINQLGHLERARVSSERVFSLLEQPGEPVSDKKIARYAGNVVFDNVSFAYKDDDYVLKNISFEAHKGETVALVGHTGSGKSSIMNLLFRFYDVSKGHIYIDGVDTQQEPKQALRSHMGIVLQEPYLFTGTIASNISLNNPAISRDTVQKALAAVGGERVLQHLPQGIDEPVIEKGSTLSSGQRQLVSFARALAYDPAILILDEATSNIDTETEEIIQHAMDVLKKGRTTFVIAHRLSTIKNADKILVLDAGEIVERGTHEELLQLGGRYAQMYTLQTK